MMFEWEWDKARQELQRALELNPSYGPARIWCGVWLWFAGRFEDANAEFRRGLEHDPLSTVIHLHLGIGLTMVREYAAASRQLLQGLELDPDDAISRACLGLVYYFQSREADGIREIQAAIEASDRDPWPLGIMGTVRAASGDRTRAEHIVAELEERAQTEYIPATHIAAVYASLGENDMALRWVDAACEEQSSFVLMCVWRYGYPGYAFEGLRANPRFQDLMRRLGLEGAR